MATAKDLMEAITMMEKQFRYQGMWQPPADGVPKIKISKKWDAESVAAAEAINRMCVIKMLPDCARFFGSVQDSFLEAFKYDYITGPERMTYATIQFNRLRADIGILPRLDLGAIPKLET